MNGFNIGDKVAYTTTGRYPTRVEGTVDGFDGVWVLVKDAAGKVRKSRPSPLTKI